MVKNFYWLILKKYKFLVYTVYTLLVLSLGGYLAFHWNCSANDYSDNVIIELFVGLLVAVIPLLIGLGIGRRINSDIYHLKFRELFNQIAQLRKNSLLRLREYNKLSEKDKEQISGQITRQLVIDITKNLGEDITHQEWYEKLQEQIKATEIRNTDCGVCGLPVEAPNNKCKFCKLNCFAWEKIDE